MTHAEKKLWMLEYCSRMGMTLQLAGECGIGRECVGIIVDGKYPEYRWYSPDYLDEIDKNGEVWTPKDAYHKHECVAVLGRGEAAEAQLYDWLKWFDKEGFMLETGTNPLNPATAAIQIIMGQHRYARLVRPQETFEQKVAKLRQNHPMWNLLQEYGDACEELATTSNRDKSRDRVNAAWEAIWAHLINGPGNTPLSAPKTDSST